MKRKRRSVGKDWRNFWFIIGGFYGPPMYKIISLPLPITHKDFVFTNRILAMSQVPKELLEARGPDSRMVH